MTEKVQQLLEKAARLPLNSERRKTISTALHYLGEIDPEKKYPRGFTEAVDRLMQVDPARLEAEAESQAQFLFH